MLGKSSDTVVTGSVRCRDHDPLRGAESLSDESRLDRALRAFRSGLFGVLFVMAKDVSVNRMWALLTMFVDWLQVRTPAPGALGCAACVVSAPNAPFFISTVPTVFGH